MPGFEVSGIPDESTLIKEYFQLMGKPYPDPYWKYYKAFYYWRGAIIIQGIDARLQSGQASSSLAALYAERTPLLEAGAEMFLEQLKLEVSLPFTPTLLGNIQLADDYCHRPTSHGNYNESCYFNFFDHQKKLGGFIRIGNRANEEYAERTICIFLPDRTALFSFARPAIKSNNGWKAAGAQVDVVRPMNKLRTSFKGTVAHLLQPADLLDPKQALTGATKTSVDVSLLHESCGPAFGKVADGQAGDQEEFAKNHYEQHMSVSGEIVIEGMESIRFSGLGLRDHSWGPRFWQATPGYRWLTGNVTSELGFTISLVGEKRVALFHLEDKGMFLFREVELETQYEAEGKWYKGLERPEVVKEGHRGLKVTVMSGKDEVVVMGKVIGFVPLRNRRGSAHTYIGEGMTEWTISSVRGEGLPDLFSKVKGIVGMGISEYLDQNVQQQPSSL